MFLTFSLSLFELFAFIGSIKSGEELQPLCETGSFSRDLSSEKNILRSLNVLLKKLHKAPLMYECMNVCICI